MICFSCGATLPEDLWTCEYCGSRTAPPQSSEKQSKASIFRRIKESPAYAQRQAPSRLHKIPNPSAFPLIVTGIGLVAWCAAGIFITFMFFKVGGLLGLVPLTMVIVSVTISLAMSGRFFRARIGPVKTEAAIVTGKRTKVGGGKHPSTHYYLTCEFENGKRIEFPIYAESVYGRVAEDDAGIIFLRNDYAVDFERVVI